MFSSAFDPFSNLSREMSIMQRQMDHLFNDAGRFGLYGIDNGPSGEQQKAIKGGQDDKGQQLSNVGQLRSPSSALVAFRPRVDVQHDKEKNAVVIQADLPGVPKENVKVQYKDGNLVISGEMQQEKKEEKSNYVYQERQSGSFFRSFPLPDTDEANIKAGFQNGVLKITVPQKKPMVAEPTNVAIA